MSSLGLGEGRQCVHSHGHHSVELDMAYDERGGHLEQQPLMTQQGGLPEGSVALSGQLAKAQPVSGRKIDGFCAVKAHVEASVVGPGKGDDKLARLLQPDISI